MKLWVAVAVITMGGCGGSQRPDNVGPSHQWRASHLVFADRVWDARSTEFPTGAGPNRWSTDGLRVLEDGESLRLAAIHRKGRWYGAEVRTPIPWGPVRVTAKVTLSQASDTLDADLVAGVFLYKNDHSELDFEVACWGRCQERTAQFVVAPASNPGRIRRFATPPGTHTYHVEFLWLPHEIRFKSRSNGRGETWVYNGPGRPVPDAHFLHLNLWFHRGRPGDPERSYEMTVRQVTILSLR